MEVKNDFPDVDRVLKKLKNYVDFYEERKVTQPSEKAFCESALQLVDRFIDAIGKYLDSVCNGDDRISKIRNSGADIKEIQEMVSAEDKMRSVNHSEIITTMLMIDRLASKLGQQRVFDYGEEFQDNFFPLIASSVEEKAKMSEKARIKRRELGNFGLYIGASVTAGMSKDHLISDEEAREFASCEGDKQKSSPEIMREVKFGAKGLKNNMNNLLR